MDRLLDTQTVDGEIGLVIDYQPGITLAVDVLSAAMGMIQALDGLDKVLLSSVNTSLEPVSVLNDVQHSSLKMMVVRALRGAPDDTIRSMQWKKWVGELLVKGKYRLLNVLDADAPKIDTVLLELEPDYKAAPLELAGYQPPSVTQVMDALDGIAHARAALPGQRVTVQTELGDILLPESAIAAPSATSGVPAEEIKNTGTEIFKVKSPDMLGDAQWTVLRGGRNVRVDMRHKEWLLAYHRREHNVQPGDSLKCRYEERISYDKLGNELSRNLAIIQVLEVLEPPQQEQQSLQ
jgi:hypothetical protein